MHRINNNKSSKQHNRFNPAWNRRELSPKLVRADSLGFSKEKNIISVGFDCSSRIYIVKKEAAFLFGQSSKEFFVRTHFGCFVSFEDESDFDRELVELREELYKSDFGGLVDPALFYPNNILFDIPVYHDALSMIPRSVDVPARPPRNSYPPFRPWK